MLTLRSAATILVLLVGAAACAQERVGVPGSSVVYTTPIESKVGDRPVKMILTGAGLRKKVIFKVYAVGSYLEDGVTARSPAELYSKDCAKQLHLVMERDVSGKEFAEALRAAVRANHAAPQFENELATLSDTMQKHAIEKGDHVWLTHVPKVGLHCRLIGKAEIQVSNVAFAQAIWEAYLGKNCICEDVKKGLASRLSQ